MLALSRPCAIQIARVQGSRPFLIQRGGNGARAALSLAYERAAPTGCRFLAAGAARLRINRLAAVFDPCVAFQLELREQAYA